MKFDVTLLSFDLNDIPTYAQAAETLGFDGFWLAETQADPFLGLVLAAEHTQRMALGSGIAVAFPRSPTVTAMMAWKEPWTTTPSKARVKRRGFWVYRIASGAKFPLLSLSPEA